MEIRRPLFHSVKVAVQPVLDLVLALSAPGRVGGAAVMRGDPWVQCWWVAP